ncbi:hypothetical protein [Cellulomonas fimi]|uniref:Uncharacterized protein n=1 Tax=Cellulomonas fimi TaxID=1708 RepID=A0A7Y0QHT7_CELFI|nr:hypothetical protein [Cellulomonas fimi]NMR21541.1 hypothetical protein [Cellulomonas fimi]
MQRVGRVWISGDPTPPGVVAGHMDAGWTLTGYINDHTEDAVRLEPGRARNGSRGKAVEFFVLAEPELDLETVPEKV